MMRRSSRRFAALAAMLAIVLQGFLPLLAQAQPGTRTLLVTLCGVEGGSHSLEITTSKTQKANEHCKLCLSGGDRDAALPATGIPVLFIQFFESKAIFVEAVRPELPQLLAARPRAPPHFS
jgi:hypothetical protein